MDLEDSSLIHVLEQSRSLGFLGPGEIRTHVNHAKCFLEPLSGRMRVLDLGSGGGLPGLALAIKMVDTEFVLLDSHVRRCAFLRQAIDDLHLSNRVSVTEGRAELLARADGLKGTFDAVVSRSFGSPAITAECAVGFLNGPGAIIAVSEPPPSEDSRWPTEGLALLNLERGQRFKHSAGTVQVLESQGFAEDRFPRRVGIPAKRPLF